MFVPASWSRLLTRSAWLAAEAQVVVALRLFKLAAGGPAAEAEYRRMIGEKWHAAAAVQRDWLLQVASGRGHAAPGRTLGAYRRRVRANRRRLLAG